jgi:hypothetical protein
MLIAAPSITYSWRWFGRFPPDRVHYFNLSTDYAVALYVDVQTQGDTLIGCSQQKLEIPSFWNS